MIVTALHGQDHGQIDAQIEDELKVEEAEAEVACDATAVEDVTAAEVDIDKNECCAPSEGEVVDVDASDEKSKILPVAAPPIAASGTPPLAASRTKHVDVDAPHGEKSNTVGVAAPSLAASEQKRPLLDQVDSDFGGFVSSGNGSSRARGLFDWRPDGPCFGGGTVPLRHCDGLPLDDGVENADEEPEEAEIAEM
jgi:hypothetical protein